MSYFGDDTPEQDLLEALWVIKRKYGITTLWVVSVIASVLQYWAEYETDDNDD